MIFNALLSYEVTARQHENAALTYTWKWSPALPSSVTVSSSAWSSEDSGLTIANEANDTDSASARLSGDTGQYEVINKIVDSAGDTHERIIHLVINDNNRTYDYGR